MGNCLNPASKLGGAEMLTREEAESLSEMKRISQVLQEEDAEDVEAAAPATTGEPAAEGLKVKIVLTRAELEWLMAQLKSGEQRLEDVLHHMHAVNGAAATRCADRDGWRPRLESILECPEPAAAASSHDVAAA